MPQSARSWCHPAELRASWEPGRPRTDPGLDEGHLGDQLPDWLPVGGRGAGLALVDGDDGAGRRPSCSAPLSVTTATG